jgi:hypothetical protein
MRCYKVSAPGTFRFAGTNAEATAARAEMAEELDIKKKEIEIEQIDIPTDKPSLLEFINELVAELKSDSDEDEDEDEDEDN